jgi:beta-lactamase class A
VQVSFPDSPTGFGWVAIELLQISGDVMTLPAVTVTDATLPTLTPTPSAIDAASVIGETPVPLSPEFTALGDQLWSMVLQSGFDPATSTMGSLFLMDLQTGQALSFGSDIAFSGMSVSKVAILAEFFRQFESPLRDDQAVTLAEAMICSENISTNELLSAIGGGNPYTGAESVSEFLQALGLTETFIYTPFANDPFITPQAPLTRQTDADQVSAQPDPYNQMTVDQMGALLNGMYQCAYNERGILLESFPDQFTPTECRQMLSVMNYNRIGSLLEVGVPENVPISHKHGWIDDTHGDAAVVFSPNGAYVLVVVLHSPQWLNFEISAPLISEISRTVYNFYNPETPLEAVRVVEGLGDVEACNYSLLGSPIIIELTTREF